MGLQSSLLSQMSMHQKNKPEWKQQSPGEWWRGWRADLRTQLISKHLHVLHLHLNVNLTKPRMWTQEDWKENTGKSNDGRRVSSSVILNLFCLDFILLFLLPLVHRVLISRHPTHPLPLRCPLTPPPPVPGPSVTLTSTAGDAPAVFRPPASLICSSLFHTGWVCICVRLGIMDCIQVHKRWHVRLHFFWSSPSDSRASCVCFCSARPPSCRQLIYNLTRQRKFVKVKLTQNRTLSPDDGSDSPEEDALQSKCCR